ncbi:HalOD1 output domain-containing protein [Natrialbaceae archaeon GCM10025810]|uniref:HalOD1 output domain-containing protein n=1 Tax=Halovalidus salilacus TaxID=3075124 RepID=UPI00361DA207
MEGEPPAERLTRVDDAAGHAIYYDESAGTYHVWSDGAAYDPVSTALVVGVASVKGMEPDTLESLSTAVDPDALDALFAEWSETRSGPAGAETALQEADSPRCEVTLTYAGCQVTIRPDGEIVIEPRWRRESTD